MGFIKFFKKNKSDINLLKLDKVFRLNPRNFFSMDFSIILNKIYIYLLEYIFNLKQNLFKFLVLLKSFIEKSSISNKFFFKTKYFFKENNLKISLSNYNFKFLLKTNLLQILDFKIKD